MIEEEHTRKKGITKEEEEHTGKKGVSKRTTKIYHNT